MNPRIADVLLIAPIPLVMLIAHPISAWLLFSVIGFVGLHEWRRIASKSRERFYSNRTRFSLALQIVVSILTYFNPLIAFVALLLGSFLIYSRERPFNRVTLVTGQIVLGLLVITSYALRSGEITGGDTMRGLSIFGLALCVSVFSDSAAYFVGKKIGRTKFAPVISPNKTWEGAIGGWVFAVIAAMIYSHFLVPDVAHWWFGFQILFFWLLAVLGQMGDLSESWFKRLYGVKDSGVTLRSHGGILDRFDSLGPILIVLILTIWVF